MPATPNTILLKGDGLFKEAPAAGTITPGHLVQRNSSGNIVVHATASGNAQPAFAVENDIMGLGCTDNYTTTANKQVHFVIPERGAEIWALVPAAAAAIVIGDLLDSNGDGTLKKYTAPSQAVAEGGAASYTIAPKVLAPVAMAIEAVDNSAGGTVARIKVEVL